MNKLLAKFVVILLLFSSSCNTIVSTKVLDKQIFTFKHAGKEMAVSVELQEIRTSRRNGISIGNRDVTYGYAMVVGHNGQQFIQDPCEKTASIDEYISKIQIKRSKDRTHFAIGKEHQTIAVFHSFRQKRFVGFAPLINPDESYDFQNLNLNGMPSVREILLDHLTGDKILKTINSNTLVDILCDLPPQDALNQEAIYMLTDNRANGIDATNEERLIKHCKKSEYWRRQALIALKDKKEDQDLGGYLSKLYHIAGKNEVDKEDWKALRNFDGNPDIEYFKLRMSMENPGLNADIKKRFKLKLEKTIYNVCALSNSNRENFTAYIQLLQTFGEKNVFEKFVKTYDKSGCKAESIHELNNSLIFMSDLKTQDKRIWVDFMVRNFKYVPANERAWDYDRIKEFLSCQEKRNIVLKYKKDIDTFGDMEIPVCN